MNGHFLYNRSIPRGFVHDLETDVAVLPYNYNRSAGNVFNEDDKFISQLPKAIHRI